MAEHASSAAAADGERFGLYIPHYVRECPDLSADEWVILSQIIQLSKQSRGCFASCRRLATEVRLPERTFHRQIRRLKARGLVIRVDNAYRTAPESHPVWTSPATDVGINAHSGSAIMAVPADKSVPDWQSDAAKMAVPDDETLPEWQSDAANMAVTEDETLPKWQSGTAKNDSGNDTKWQSSTAKMAVPSEHEVNKKFNKKLNSSGSASLAKGREEKSSSDSDLFPESPKPSRHRPRTRTSTPLEEKLLDICGLRPLLGTKAFPGSRFGKTLSVLRDLQAAPEELDRFISWWRAESISYKRTFPALEHVAGHFHESRPKDYWPAKDADDDDDALPESEEKTGGTSVLSAKQIADEYFNHQPDPRFRRMVLASDFADAIRAGDENQLEEFRFIQSLQFPDEDLEAAARRRMEEED